MWITVRRPVASCDPSKSALHDDHKNPSYRILRSPTSAVTLIGICTAESEADDPSCHRSPGRRRGVFPHGHFSAVIVRLGSTAAGSTCFLLHNRTGGRHA